MTIVNFFRQFIYCIKKKKEAGESLSHRPGRGGSNKIMDNDFLLGLMAEIEADLTRSMRKLAKDLGASKFTINNAVRKLGLHSYERRRHQLLSKTTKNSRVECSKKIINWLKKKPSLVILVFSDKKTLFFFWTMASGAMLRAKPVQPPVPASMT